jgi:hypothetical protein
MVFVTYQGHNAFVVVDYFDVPKGTSEGKYREDVGPSMTTCPYWP